jgi:hypothetical protein
MYRTNCALAGLRRGGPGYQGSVEQKERGYQLSDTDFTKFTPIDQLFVIIRVIRVFMAAFPRRVFGNADRSATDPRMDRA